jgi:hypothetical protein
LRVADRVDPGGLTEEEREALNVARAYHREEACGLDKARALLAGRQEQRLREARRCRALVVEGKDRYGQHWSKERGEWVPDNYTRKIGKRVVEWREAGWSLEQIRDHLLARGVKTRGGKVWTLGMVIKVYVGECRLRDAEWKSAAAARKAGEGAASIGESGPGG